MNKYLFILFVSILVPNSFIFAHPGRTDGSGCHTCRTNCSNWGLSTGEYHCHNAKTAPQPIEPIKSTYGVNGTGYTTPAPEYKQPLNTNKKTLETVPVKKETKTTSATTPIKNEVKKASLFSKFINWFK